MAADARNYECVKSAVAEPGDGVRYVRRGCQSLDLRSKVHAYELLFSGGPGNASSGDREKSARTMLDSTVLFGLEKLTCGLPGFVKLHSGDADRIAG